MKTIRIFISSTFRDMHSERDYLVKYVFPELRERCMKKGLYLVDVDLRWGVTQEDAEQGKALELCLDEIENCRPFFIGLLGERYGWIPEWYQVPDYPKFDWLKKIECGHSITALEIFHGVLNNPEMHSSAFFYFRDATFQKNVPANKLNDIRSEDDNSLIKLQNLKSEIRRVYKEYNLLGHITESYPCSFKGLKLNLAQINEVYAGIEKATDLAALKKAVDENNILATNAYNKLNNRQKRIAEKYSIVYLNGLEEFGKRVLYDLWRAIEERYPDEEQVTCPLIVENNYHKNFLLQRIRLFSGRKKIIESIFNYLNDHESRKPLFVKGDSGSGKSSLMSVVVKNFRGQNPDVFCLVRFVGASPDSLDLFKLIANIVKQLESHFGIDHETERISNSEKLWEHFREFLWKIGKDNRLLLVIDAVNQIHPSLEPQYLSWLPKYLPETVKLIVSTLEGDYTQRAGQLDLPIISVKPLGRSEIRSIIENRLGEFRKKLSKEQMQLLLTKKESVKPLYLAVACEELRTYPQFELISQRIAVLPNHTHELFIQVLERIEQDHGRQLVTEALSLIECSQHGLMEEELLELLAKPLQGKLPANTWARLYRDIGLHLSNAGENKEGPIRLFHQQFSDAVKQRYLPDAKTEKIYYQKLANYGIAQFEQKPEVVGNCLRYVGVYLYKSNKSIEIKSLIEDVFIIPHNKQYDIIIEELLHYLIKYFDFKEERRFKKLFLEFTQKYHSIDLANLIKKIVAAYCEGNHIDWVIFLSEVIIKSLGLKSKLNNCIISKIILIAWFNEVLGTTFSRIGNSEKALQYFLQQKKALIKAHHYNTNQLQIKKNLSESYHNLGHIYNDLGLIRRGGIYIRKQSKIIKDLLKIQPQNIDFMREYAINYSNQGNYFDALKVWGNLISIDDENTDYIFENAACQLNVGCQFVNNGKLVKALALIKKSEMGIVYLHHQFPDVVKYSIELSIIKNSIGWYYSLIDNTDQSIAFYKASSEIMFELHSKEPRRIDVKRRFSISLNLLGRSYEKAGRLNDAKSCYKQALNLMSELVHIEPKYINFKNDLGVSLGSYGLFLMNQKIINEAKAHFKKAIAISEELANDFSQNINFKRELAVQYNLQGLLLSKENDYMGSLAYFIKALRLLKKLSANAPTNLDFKSLSACLHFNYSASLEGLDKKKEAIKELEKSLYIQKDLIANDKKRMEWMYDHLRILSKLSEMCFTEKKYKKTDNYSIELIELINKLLLKTSEKSTLVYWKSLALSHLGLIHLKWRNKKIAREYFIKELRISKNIASDNTNSITEQIDLAISYWNYSSSCSKKERILVLKKAYNILHPFMKSGINDQTLTELFQKIKSTLLAPIS